MYSHFGVHLKSCKIKMENINMINMFCVA